MPQVGYDEEAPDPEESPVRGDHPTDEDQGRDPSPKVTTESQGEIDARNFAQAAANKRAGLPYWCTDSCTGFPHGFHMDESGRKYALDEFGKRKQKTPKEGARGPGRPRASGSKDAAPVTLDSSEANPQDGEVDWELCHQYRDRFNASRGGRSRCR